jgi:hypothetical protein
MQKPHAKNIIKKNEYILQIFGWLQIKIYAEKVCRINVILSHMSYYKIQTIEAYNQTKMCRALPTVQNKLNCIQN